MIKVKDAPNPEMNKLIRCNGYDWSPFTVEGMFIKGVKGSPRFCMKGPDGKFQSERGTWKDVEEYEYIESDLKQHKS